MKSNKIILVFCALLLTSFVAIKILGDDIKVTSLLKQHYGKKDAEIIEGEGFLKYKSDINKIEDVTWINEDVVEFNGTSKNNDETNSFTLDYDAKEISMSDEKVEVLYHKDFEDNVLYITEIGEDNHLLYTEEKDRKGLFYIKKDSKPLLLSDDISFNGETLFKVSDNKKKVAYYDANEKKLKVYSFNSNKKVDIDEEINADLLSNFQRNIGFSYEAGYLTVSRVSRSNFKESYFAVYGADSGKVYAENLLGTNPVWAKDSLTVSFNYLEDNSIANTENTTMENLAGDRVGFFNLKTRGIKYTQTMGKGYKVIKPVIWKNKNEALFFVGQYSKESNKYFFSNVYSFNTKNNILTDLKGAFEDINDLGVDFGIELIENHLYIHSNYNQQNKAMKVINIENRNVKEISNVQDFLSKDEENERRILFKPLESNRFLYMQNDCIYITDLNDSYLKYRSQNTIIKVYESPERNRLLLVCQGDDGLEFIMIDRFQ